MTSIGWPGHGHKWPPRQAASWPEWRRLLTDSTAWFKRRVSKWMATTLMRQHKQHRYDICLWAMARRGKAGQTMGAGETQRWICRQCDASLKTKAALGAHFFKSHKRAARYRAVVTGSYCRALWTGMLDKKSHGHPPTSETILRSRSASAGSSSGPADARSWESWMATAS